MKSEKQMNEQEQTTEEKILEAASEVFTEKGFAGTRTRDIAEKAGINLTTQLLFPSKKTFLNK